MFSLSVPEKIHESCAEVSVSYRNLRQSILYPLPEQLANICGAPHSSVK